MTTFIIRRLLSVPTLLLGVSLIVFVLLRSAPGDFFEQMEADPTKSLRDVLQAKVDAGLLRRVPRSTLVEIGPFEAKGHTWRFRDDAVLQNGEEVAPGAAAITLGRFGAGGRRYQCDEDLQIYQQIGALRGYFYWLGNALRLNFGHSFKFDEDVFGLIQARLWNTLKLSLAALILAWGFSIPLGVFAAIRPNSLLDHSAGLFAFIGLSIPSVFFALLMVLFASYTGWFPVGEMRAIERWPEMNWFQRRWDEIHHVILPAVVISTGAMAQYMRQTRGNMIEALSQDYVRTARAKGLPPQQVFFKHALRNAINPLVTLFGYSLAYLFAGSFLVEVVMNWPGMARLVVDAIFARDEPLVMAAVLFSSVLLIAGNLVADLLLAVVDPRVRLS